MSDTDRTEYKRNFNKENYERVYVYMRPELKEKWIKACQIEQGVANKKKVQLSPFVKKIVNDYLGIEEEKPPRKKRRSKKEMEAERNGEMHPVDDPDDEITSECDVVEPSEDYAGEEKKPVKDGAPVEKTENGPADNPNENEETESEK